MQYSYLFVVNPIAGAGNTNDFYRAYQQWQSRSSHRSEIFETTGTQDAANLTNRLQAKNYTHCIAVGGDGTFLLVAKVARQRKLTVGFIPQGSANGMAQELGLPDGLPQLFERIESNRTKACDMLCFNKSQWGVHISDLGLNAALVEQFEASESRGFWAYGEGIFKKLPQFEAFDVEITCGTKTRQFKALMVAIANARYYGTGASLNGIGRLDDGLFEVCILKDLNAKALAEHFLDALDPSSDHLEVWQCEAVTIKAPQPQAFQIDGELQQKLTELSVDLHPQALQIVY